MKNRRGQMRIIEAVFACGIILVAHYVISYSNITTHKPKEVEIETIGENLLNLLEDPSLLMTITNDEGEWRSSLQQLIESIIPPNMLYNISLTSLVDTGNLSETVTNMEDGGDSSTYDSETIQGVYTFSFPLIKDEEVRIDIMMLIDISGSMGWVVPGDDEPKIYYARQAACNFIDKLNSTTDRVGVVSFSYTATLNEPLTFNHTSVKTTINGDELDPGGATNIGHAFEIATPEFGRTDTTWAIVFLSDGVPNRPTDKDPVQYAEEQAQLAKDRGIWIYSIGLGAKDYLDEDLLKNIQTDGYYYAPSAQDLEEIFQTIVKDLIYETKYDMVLITITLSNP